MSQVLCDRRFHDCALREGDSTGMDAARMSAPSPEVRRKLRESASSRACSAVAGIDRHRESAA